MIPVPDLRELVARPIDREIFKHGHSPAFTTPCYTNTDDRINAMSNCELLDAITSGLNSHFAANGL